MKQSEKDELAYIRERGSYRCAVWGNRIGFLALPLMFAQSMMWVVLAILVVAAFATIPFHIIAYFEIDEPVFGVRLLLLRDTFDLTFW